MSFIHGVKGVLTTVPAAGGASRRLPPLNMLRAFEAAGRLLSVTHAARELSVTQSAVSHQIKALEEWLGVALVARNGRHLALTPPGAALLPGITGALDMVAQPSRASSGSAVARHWWSMPRPRLPLSG